MTKYIVEVWAPTPKSVPNAPEDDLIPIERKEFWDPIDAWNWVLENKIERYAIWKAECVVDNG